MVLKKNDVILFDGDSITDALRDRSDYHSLAGYSKFISEKLSENPENRIVCFNRGVGGDTSAQLLERLEGELEELRPTLFSVLVGVNDCWRRFDSNAPVPCKTFSENLKKILELASRYVQRIVVMQPFLLDVDPKKRKFRKDLDPKIRASEKIAKGYGAEYIPLDAIFSRACEKVSPSEFSYDGVHPTERGHRLIAAEWLGRIKTER